MQNETLTAEIGLQYANAVTETDRQKFRAKLEQRRDRYGQLWNNNGEFNRQIMDEIVREDDGYELAVLWDAHAKAERVDIVNCRRVDLNTPEMDRAFEQAPWMVKTKPVRARQIPEGTTEVISVKSGATSDTVQGGDWAVRKQKPDGTWGEEYPVKRATFDGLYDFTAEAGVYQPKWDPRKLVQVSENVIFMAPWGELQAVRKGGYIMEAINPATGEWERYGISQIDAEGDFVPASSRQ